jgi:pSer/pThr/pTyr-binding forkhead associated (FHA) protein
VASETLVFQVPRVVSASALLSEIRPDGSRREVQVDGSPLTIGRATDNAVVVADGRASRHHARIQARRGALVLTDLGSTNGTRVNGVPVTEVVLGQGDRIEIGRTVLLVDALPESA